MTSRDMGAGASEGGGALLLADSLRVLREILQHAAQGSIQQLLTIAVDALNRHQDIDACEIYLAPEAAGPCSELSANQSAQTIPPGLCELILREVLPSLVDDTSIYVQPNLQARDDELSGNLLGVPIRTRHDTIGGLVVWNRQAASLMPWHQHLLEMVAQVLALAFGAEPGPFAEGAAAEQKAAPATPFGAPAFPPGGSVSSALPEHLDGFLDRQAFEKCLRDQQLQPLEMQRSRYFLHIDIDRFRMVREYGGALAADRLIRVLAELLRAELAHQAVLGRVGVDEFSVVIERQRSGLATRFAQDLVDKVDRLYLSFAGQRFDISISIGVAEIQPGISGAGIAAKQALQACRAAQAKGGGTAHFYNERITRASTSHTDGRMLNLLTRALKENALLLYAQRIAPSSTLTEASASQGMQEVLLRMRNAAGELIGAGEFLPVAERHGLSVKLDRWVIRHAFARIAASRQAGDAQQRFCINLSGHSIDDHRLLDYIVEQFAASGLAPHRICFEITETAAISDILAAQHFVTALRELGCAFALDDFGSGHSSFLYLRDLPIDYLKIDGELVREIAVDPISLALVRSIESVGRLMGRKTIAEYVQSAEIGEAVREIGCDYLQGYWISAPVPLDEVLDSPAPARD